MSTPARNRPVSATNVALPEVTSPPCSYGDPSCPSWIVRQGLLGRYGNWAGSSGSGSACFYLKNMFCVPEPDEPLQTLWPPGPNRWLGNRKRRMPRRNISSCPKPSTFQAIYNPVHPETCTSQATCNPVHPKTCTFQAVCSACRGEVSSGKIPFNKFYQPRPAGGDEPALFPQRPILPSLGLLGRYGHWAGSSGSGSACFYLKNMFCVPEPVITPTNRTGCFYRIGFRTTGSDPDTLATNQAADARTQWYVARQDEQLRHHTRGDSPRRTSDVFLDR